MVNATKKQMVEFINSRCRVKGKKIPKTKLNQLSKEDLAKIIVANEEMEKVFSAYIKNENACKGMSVIKSETKKQDIPDKKRMAMKTQSNQKLTEELTYLMEQLIKDSTSFLAVMEFKRFIENLPYGSVDFDTLNNMIDKVMEIDSGIAFLLLEYATNQELYLQDINADNVESLSVCRNMKDVLKNVYFLTISAFDNIVNYREIVCFATEEDLKDYIKNEFSGTDGEEIVNYTITQLMEGKSYSQGHRMGAGTTLTHVQVIHNTNLTILYDFLDSVELENDDGEQVRLSLYLQKAKSFQDIEDVICEFNEACENYW